jgi:outer membrane protein OmpA-like peptidoglycan-associated protein
MILDNNRWGGLVVDYSRHDGVSVQASELALGLQLRKHVWRLVPFGEAMVGIHDFAFKGLPSQVKPVWIAGGGVDVKLTSRLSMRPIEISYVGASYNTQNQVSSTPQIDSLSGVRVQSGLIYNLSWGSSAGEVLAACSAQPATVDGGTPVKIGVKTKGFTSKRNLRYTYESTGGTITGNAATETLDTKGLSPGKYTVVAKVVDNGRGKHQLSAGCETNFSVTTRTSQAPPPPAEPTKVPQAPSNPSASAQEPVTTQEAAKQDRAVPAAQEPADAGNATAAGKTVQTPTKTSVESLPPQPLKFGAIAFNRDLKRPTRVDNEAKGELDRYADALAAMPDGKGIVVGYTPAKKENANNKQVFSFARQRAVNTKDYLTKQKGIDSARIQPRIGRGHAQITELWIIPAGGSLAAGTTAVDEGKVKPVPRIALKARKSKTKTHKAVHKSDLRRSCKRRTRRVISPRR